MNRPIRVPLRPVAARPQQGQSCKALLAKLQAVDFSIYDTLLYLDAYPDNRSALAHLEKLKSERGALYAAMKECGCPPITPTDDAPGAYRWVSTPWPWQPESN